MGFLLLCFWRYVSLFHLLFFLVSGFNIGRRNQIPIFPLNEIFYSNPQNLCSHFSMKAPVPTSDLAPVGSLCWASSQATPLRPAWIGNKLLRKCPLTLQSTWLLLACPQIPTLDGFAHVGVRVRMCGKTELGQLVQTSLLLVLQKSSLRMSSFWRLEALSHPRFCPSSGSKQIILQVARDGKQISLRYRDIRFAERNVRYCLCLCEGRCAPTYST
jgi:hypothetical protein